METTTARWTMDSPEFRSPVRAYGAGGVSVHPDAGRTHRLPWADRVSRAEPEGKASEHAREHAPHERRVQSVKPRTSWRAVLAPEPFAPGPDAIDAAPHTFLPDALGRESSAGAWPVPDCMGEAIAAFNLNDGPTAVQERVLKAVWRGHSGLVLAPSGSGSTTCAALAALCVAVRHGDEHVDVSMDADMDVPGMMESTVCTPSVLVLSATQEAAARVAGAARYIGHLCRPSAVRCLLLPDAAPRPSYYGDPTDEGRDMRAVRCFTGAVVAGTPESMAAAMAAGALATTRVAAVLVHGVDVIAAGASAELDALLRVLWHEETSNDCQIVAFAASQSTTTQAAADGADADSGSSGEAAPRGDDSAVDGGVDGDADCVRVRVLDDGLAAVLSLVEDRMPAAPLVTHARADATLRRSPDEALPTTVPVNVHQYRVDCERESWRWETLVDILEHVGASSTASSAAEAHRVVVITAKADKARHLAEKLRRVAHVPALALVSDDLDAAESAALRAFNSPRPGYCKVLVVADITDAGFVGLPVLACRRPTLIVHYTMPAVPTPTASAGAPAPRRPLDAWDSGTSALSDTACPSWADLADEEEEPRHGAAAGRGAGGGGAGDPSTSVASPFGGAGAAEPRTGGGARDHAGMVRAASPIVAVDTRARQYVRRCMVVDAGLRDPPRVVSVALLTGDDETRLVRGTEMRGALEAIRTVVGTTTAASTDEVLPELPLDFWPGP